MPAATSMEASQIEAVDAVDISGAYVEKAGETTRVETVGSKESGIAIAETDRLLLARQILGCLFVAFLLVTAAYIWQPDSKATAAIFELVKIGVLPLVTLVIGFYFPNSSR